MGQTFQKAAPKKKQHKSLCGYKEIAGADVTLRRNVQLALSVMSYSVISVSVYIIYSASLHGDCLHVDHGDDTIEPNVNYDLLYRKIPKQNMPGAAWVKMQHVQ